MSIVSKIIIGILSALLILAMASAVYFYYSDRQKPTPSQSTYMPAPEIKEVVKVKKVEVPGPEKIVTVEKEVVVEKLKLPPSVQAPEKQIVATASIEPYEGKTNAVAVMDTKTGESEIIVKQEPLSLFGFVNKKELYARAGYSTSWDTQISVGGRWQFLRIGKIKIGTFAEGKASFSTDETKSTGEAVAGVEVSF